MKLLLEKWNKFLNEEEELDEVAGMSPKDFAKMDDAAALALIKQQKKEREKRKEEEKLISILKSVTDEEGRLVPMGSEKTLRMVNNAYLTLQRKYGYENPALGKDLDKEFEAWSRGPHAGAVGGKY